jgi:hypothetical protein
MGGSLPPRRKYAESARPRKLSLTIFCHGTDMDLPATYVATTESLLATLSMSHQLGHLNAGLIIYLGVQYLLDARRGDILPVLAVFLAEFGNEAIQATYYGSWRTEDTIADIGWTVFWPCMLFAHARYRQVSRRQVTRPHATRTRRRIPLFVRAGA